MQIFASFYRHEETAFPTLVDELEVTEGNLSSHLQRMEEADAVAVEKAVVDRTSRTTYELTSAGRELFEEHIGRLEAPIDGLTEE